MKKTTTLTPLSPEEMVDFLQKKFLNFRTIYDFGDFVSKLNEKTHNHYNLVKSLNFKKITTLEEYIKQYSELFPNIKIDFGTLSEIYDAAIFWGCECTPSNFTPEEIVTIIISRLYSIQCCVLYKKDIAPESNSEYSRTIISSYKNHFTKLVFLK